MSKFSRRKFFAASGGAVLGAGLARSSFAAPETVHPPRLTAVELFPVRATERTVWLFVRIRTNTGVTGLGEASDAFGYLNTTREQAAHMAAELHAFFALIQGRSPLDIAWYRQAGVPRARAGGLVAATAFSAIEQAMWDLAGKLLNQPVYNLLGGKVRGRLPVYASINRATRLRTPRRICR